MPCLSVLAGELVVMFIMGGVGGWAGGHELVLMCIPLECVCVWGGGRGGLVVMFITLKGV